MAKLKITNSPSVSVVVAMYNAEMYIEQCLESLLSQTYKDYEVIVVDDGSSDNSVGIVKKIKPSFEGRLKLIERPRNSGFPGVPRNAAMKTATGKYIMFLDSDDMLTDNAVEVLYNVAENTNADVVHLESCYRFNENDLNTAEIYTFQETELVKDISVDSENIGERIMNFTKKGTVWWAWNKIFRREFLQKNNIKFPEITAWEDMVFTFCCVACAKIYVRVPNILYFYRIREDSLSHKKVDIFRQTSNLIDAVKFMDRFIGKVRYFNENPQFRYMFLDWFIQGRMRAISRQLYFDEELETFQIDELFRKKIFSVAPEDNAALTSYLFTALTYYQLLSVSNSVKIKELQKEIAKLKNIS